jgi:hypothetical protein
MKQIQIICALFISLVCHAAENKPLTNGDVVSMVKAQLPPSTILLAINGGPNSFDKSARALIALKNDGVSTEIIEAMLTAQSSEKEPSAGREAGPLSKNSIPSVEEVKKLLAAKLQTETKGIIQLLSFKKLDGQARNVDGVAVYTIYFEATTQSNNDHLWDLGESTGELKLKLYERKPPPSGRTFADMQLYRESEQLWNQPSRQVHFGDQCLVVGTARLQRTERGWQIGYVERQSIKNLTRANGAVTSVSTSGVQPPSRTESKAGIEDGETSALLKRPIKNQNAAEPIYTSKNAKVSVRPPTGFKFEEPRGNGIVAAFVGGTTGAEKILVTWSQPSSSKNLPLEQATKNTIEGCLETSPDAIVSGVAKHKLAGFDANCFFVTGTQKGKPTKRAFMIAVGNRQLLGVVLISTPQEIEKNWDAFRQVCESYVLPVK